MTKSLKVVILAPTGILIGAGPANAITFRKVPRADVVFLTAEGFVNLAAAAAFEAWASAYSLNADSERIGDYNYAQSISKKMLENAARLRNNEAAKPVFEWAEPDLLGTEEGDT